MLKNYPYIITKPQTLAPLPGDNSDGNPLCKQTCDVLCFLISNFWIYLRISGARECSSSSVRANEKENIKTIEKFVEDNQLPKEFVKIMKGIEI